MRTERFSDLTRRMACSAMLMGTLVSNTALSADEPKPMDDKPSQEVRLSQLPLEQLIERTLAKSPDVRAAESAVVEAQIALERARQSAAREVAATRSAVELQQLQIEGLQSRLQAASEEGQLVNGQLKAGQTTPQEALRADIKIKESKNLLRIEEAKLFDIEDRLKYLAGAKDLTASSPAPSAGLAASNKPTPRKTIDPLTDPNSETMRQKFLAIAEQPTELQFVNQNLVEVLIWLSDFSKIQFVLHEDVLHEADMDRLLAPITIHLKDVSFAAAIQALQDLRPPLRFVVRPYGILVTVERGEPNGSITLEELYRANKSKSHSTSK